MTVNSHALTLQVFTMNQRKSNEKSEKLRAEANRLYVQKKFYDALLKYNESLCFAVPESENMGLAYANRAAVYFEMKLYDKCLNNIKMAKQNQYPEASIEVLKKREEKCRDSMKQQKSRVATDPWSFFKLSYPANKKLPFIADCLELKVDNKYGKHIVTNRALKVGDIVAIDDPTFKVIKADSRYSTCFDSNAFQRCGNCLNDNLLCLIPCSSCTKTMYCSIDCMNSAQQRHHQYECEIIDELLTTNMHMVLRMFFEGLSLFNGDINEMESYLRRYDDTMTVYEIDFKSKDDKERLKKMFLATLSLVSSTVLFEEISLDDYENMFEKTEKLEKLWDSKEYFIKIILSKLVQVNILYVHGIGGWSLKNYEVEDAEQPKNPSLYQQVLANGCYLFCSLLNHSCAPNIKRLNVADKVVVIVSRAIESGQQLFDSYRPNFNNQPKDKRQEALMQDYGFTCDCEACENDWPINKDLQVFSEELLEHAWTEHEELPFLSREGAKKKLKEHYDIITQHHQQFPSAELIVLQECISNCLITITKPDLQFP